MTIFFYKGLTKNPEIAPYEFCPIPTDWGELRIPNLTRMFLIKSHQMLKNARVIALLG